MRKFVVVIYDEYDNQVEAYGFDCDNRRPTYCEVMEYFVQHKNAFRWELYEEIYKRIKRLSRG